MTCASCRLAPATRTVRVCASLSRSRPREVEVCEPCEGRMAAAGILERRRAV